MKLDLEKRDAWDEDGEDAPGDLPPDNESEEKDDEPPHDDFRREEWHIRRKLEASGGNAWERLDSLRERLQKLSDSERQLLDACTSQSKVRPRASSSRLRSNP